MNDCTYCMNPDYCLLLMRCCIGCEKCSQYEKTENGEDDVREIANVVEFKKRMKR